MTRLEAYKRGNTISAGGVAPPAEAPIKNWAESYAQQRNRPVLLLGYGVFFFVTLSLLVPPYMRNTQQFTSAYVLLCSLYTLLAIGVARAFVRPVFPIAILLTLQVWNLVAFAIVAPQIVPYAILGRHLYWPTLLALPYFVLGSIIILDPSWRTRAIKILFWFSMISALVGIAQFLRVPGFAALQAYYSPLSIRQDFWGDVPNLYRAVGLSMHPYILAAQCIFGMALIGSNLLHRKLFPLEIFSFVIFLGALFVAQSRAYYASAIILLVVVLVLMYRRDKVVFFSSIAAMAVCGILLITVFPKRLEYGFRGSTLAQSGRLEVWEAPIRAVREFPLSGVGPNPTLFGNEGRNVMLENRRRLEYPENGYRMVLGTMGLPGLAIMLVGLFGSLILAIKVVRNKSAELLQRRMAFVGGLYVVSILVALNITNLFENELLTYLGVCTAAICLPDVGKAFHSARTKRKLGYGFANGPEPDITRS